MTIQSPALSSTSIVDTRPREERSLDEIYPKFNPNSSIILMNVPQQYLQYYKKQHKRLKSEPFQFFTTGSPGQKLDISQYLPGAIKRLEHVKQTTKPSIFETIPYSSTKPPSLPTEYFNETIDQPNPLEESSLSNEHISLVEYDLDTLDRSWLELYNNLDSYTLEKLINIFEKEWLQLTYPIILDQETHIYPDESKCCICGGSDASNSDMIIFCDRCDIAVHQACYGVPNVPEGKWMCLPCAWSPNEEISCVLCPQPTGAFKQTDTGQWAHTVCAHWIQETGFSNETYLEPITGVEDIPKTRWNLKCKLCSLKNVGAPIQCSARNCNFSYHVTCAQKANLYMDYTNKKSYCPKHGPEMKSTNTITYKHPTTENVKISQVPPVLPEHLLQKIYWNHVNILPNLTPSILLDVAKYWTLRRERKGAPLIKRIQLEPSIGINILDESSIIAKQKLLRPIRLQLESLRLLLELSQRIQSMKLKIQELSKYMFQLWKHPLYYEMKLLLSKLRELDTKKLFELPVSLELVPDYTTVIKHPMDFQTIETKLDSGAYHNLSTLKSDFVLICTNAMIYNKSNTIYYKSAEYLYKHGIELINTSIQYMMDNNINTLEDSMSFDAFQFITVEFK